MKLSESTSTQGEYQGIKSTSVMLTVVLGTLVANLSQTP
jgi:hypothetical protein